MTYGQDLVLDTVGKLKQFIITDKTYLDIRSRKLNVSGNDYRHIFGLKRSNYPMCPQLQHLTVVASHTDAFAGGSYGGNDVRGTEEGHHRFSRSSDV